MTESSAIAQLIKPLTPRQKPPILYHYTSGAGLIGILQTRSIWATSIRFLNDSSEFNFALNLASSVVRERRDKAHNRFELGIYSVLEERLTSVADAEVYVISFTENGDQLSQWRAYCPPSGGYAIGFASKFLVQAPRANPNRFLARCLYRSQAQEKLISEVVTTTVESAEGSRAAGIDQDRIFRESYKLLGRLLGLVAPALKASSFQEECEWRLVCLANSFEGSSLNFRPGRSTVIPYYEHSLKGRSRPRPIDELVIGPTPNPDLARDAAHALLSSSHKMGSIIVRSSLIPYRTW